jgi:hypothetical protein
MNQKIVYFSGLFQDFETTFGMIFTLFDEKLIFVEVLLNDPVPIIAFLQKETRVKVLDAF